MDITDLIFRALYSDLALPLTIGTIGGLLAAGTDNYAGTARNDTSRYKMAAKLGLLSAACVLLPIGPHLAQLPQFKYQPDLSDLFIAGSITVATFLPTYNWFCRK